MKRVHVYRTSDNQLGWMADFEDPTGWIQEQQDKNAWGLPEREVADPEWVPPEPPRDEEGNVLPDYVPPAPPMITLPAEYRVEIIDLTADPAWKLDQVRRKRAAEYPPIGDQLDAIWKLLNDAADAEANAIRQKITDVKARHPKP